MKQNSCKICANKTETWHDKQFEIDYYFCDYCKFIFMDEKNIISIDEEIKVYEQHDNTLENQGYVDMFKEFIDKSVRPYQKNIKKALDFGSGPGPVLAILLRKMELEVDVYDIYFAPEKIYEGKSYDLITATEVFEHLKNPLETMRFLKNHLKKDGILAVMTLFHPGNAQEFNDWWYRRDPTHISFYRPETFMVIADILGLEVLKHDNKNTLVMKERIC